jgi:hypothetical protein
MGMKPKPTLITVILTTMLTFGTSVPGFAHGGGLDWQGGHNCRVGSCAGTYHCHQARAGVCASSADQPNSSPKVSKKVSVLCIKESDENLNRNQVAMIQFKLNALGYQVGTQDGSYGSMTIKALNRFEMSSKLKKSTSSIIQNDSLVLLGAMC